GNSSSDSGQPAATSFRDTVILEAQNWYYTSQTNHWDEFPNDPDAYFYDYVTWSVENFSKAYPINLPDPDTSGANASIKVEFFSLGQVLLGLVEQDHAATVTLNNDPNVGVSPTPWKGRRSENTYAFIPASTLLDGTNNVNVVFATNIDDGVNSTTDRLLINDITVEYNRFFVAVDDQLIFDHAGQHAFTISELATNVPADLNIWEITNPLQPVRLDSTSASITGSGPYSVSFGDSTTGDIAYIVATEAAIIDVAPADLTEYNGPDLDPAGGADWIAISHSTMLTAANNLATHRSNALYGGMTTQVVDVLDIYNQYGYGFALPTAIQDYLSHAMNDWPSAPGYVVLFGDANINPNGHPTLNGTSWWIADEPNYVVTDFQFVDRFLGLIPSDHIYSTLIGPDLIPDIAVGRLAAQSNAEAQAMVDKIIFFEQNGQSPAGLAGHDEVIFVSDNEDDGGNFCEQNRTTAYSLPDSFTAHPLCLDEMPINDLRQSMKDLVNSPDGVLLLNYRGHGAVHSWASTSPPNAILHVNTPSFWLNPGKPPIILSFDCLDGNFAQPGFPGLGETILGYEMKGTAGHWSSAGLGFGFEHDLLATEFYDGVFGQGMVRFGDAVNFAKAKYWQASNEFGYDISELYSFNLQGDPAMHLFRSEVSLDKQVNATNFLVGDPVTLTLTIENNALYPAHVVITDTMPVGVTYLGYSATTTATLVGPEPTFALSWGADMTDTVHAGIPAGAQATLEIYGVAAVAGAYDHTAQLQVTGFDLNMANNQATVSYDIMQKILLPIIVRR
ncbi:MAG: DUF11 domain-containing protein, partial [Anaerolineales bacterium]|nr:DUF11 domain-containing protein [Anaerolineales bacterium]